MILVNQDCNIWDMHRRLEKVIHTIYLSFEVPDFLNGENWWVTSSTQPPYDCICKPHFLSVGTEARTGKTRQDQNLFSLTIVRICYTNRRKNTCLKPLERRIFIPCGGFKDDNTTSLDSIGRRRTCLPENRRT